VNSRMHSTKSLIILPSPAHSALFSSQMRVASELKSKCYNISLPELGLASYI